MFRGREGSSKNFSRDTAENFLNEHLTDFSEVGFRIAISIGRQRSRVDRLKWPVNRPT